MATSPTVREFFEVTLPPLLAEGRLAQVGGTLGFEISGEEGGRWYVDLDRGEISTDPRPVDLLLRAHELDMLAMLEGQLSPADALVTERLQVAGEVARMMRLAEALRGLRLG
jgi:putative sterol carrier protein